MKLKKKESKPKDEPFIIEEILNGLRHGLLDDKDVFWKNHIPCICNGINDLKNCKNCKYTDRENKLPRKAFQSNGRTINKITVMRGSDGDIYAINY